MFRTILVFLAIVAAAPAMAQQQSQHAPERIAAQIGSMFIQIEQQRDQIASLQDRLAKANARIKDLEGRKSEKPEEELKEKKPAETP